MIHFHNISNRICVLERDVSGNTFHYDLLIPEGITPSRGNYVQIAELITPLYMAIHYHVPMKSGYGRVCLIHKFICVITSYPKIKVNFKSDMS